MRPRSDAIAGSVLVLLGMLHGCESRSPTPAALGPTASPPGTSTAAPADALPWPDADGLAPVPELAAKLATLRGLALSREVPVTNQDAAGHRALLREDLDRELPAAVADQITTAMVHLGLLPSPIDLRTYLVDAQLRLAGAYYSTTLKQIFVREVLDAQDPGDRRVMEASLLHELTHALQDQHYDMSAYLASTLDSDTDAARRFVAEGDAMVVQEAYRHGESLPASPRLVRQFEAAAARDPLEDLNATARSDVPLYLAGPSVEVYFKGPLVILAALQRGGWDEVGRLYLEPVESTAQVLHPETKLYPKRQHPRRIELPVLAGFRELHSDVVGELGWRMYFEQWHSPAPAVAAAGWAGDRVRVWRGPRGGLLAVIVTSWDTVEDANEFVAAYVASLGARFPAASARDPEARNGARCAPDHHVLVRRSGATVFIVDGEGAIAQLARVTAGTRIAARKR